MTRSTVFLAAALGLMAGASLAGEKSTGGIGDVWEIYPIYTLDRTSTDTGAPLVTTPQGQRILAARHRNGQVATASGQRGIVGAYLQSLDR